MNSWVFLRIEHGRLVGVICIDQNGGSLKSVAKNSDEEIG